MVPQQPSIFQRSKKVPHGVLLRSTAALSWLLAQEPGEFVETWAPEHVPNEKTTHPASRNCIFLKQQVKISQVLQSHCSSTLQSLLLPYAWLKTRDHFTQGLFGPCALAMGSPKDPAQRRGGEQEQLWLNREYKFCLMRTHLPCANWFGGAYTAV